jgi:hypothetical protein
MPILQTYRTQGALKLKTMITINIFEFLLLCFTGKLSFLRVRLFSSINYLFYITILLNYHFITKNSISSIKIIKLDDQLC